MCLIADRHLPPVSEFIGKSGCGMRLQGNRKSLPGGKWGCWTWRLGSAMDRRSFFGRTRTSSPAPYLRKEFTLQKQLVSARLYVTAIGLYECHLMAPRWGCAPTPGWTDYCQHIQYQVYDVTDLLRAGTNAIGAIFGDGWGVGHIAWLGASISRPPSISGANVLTYTDGSKEIIGTDNTWKVTSGPDPGVGSVDGGSYDARRELPVGRILAITMRPGALRKFFGSGAVLVANGPAVKRYEELRPGTIDEIPDFDPRWIFDLGRTWWVGYACAVAEKQEGQLYSICRSP